PAIHRLPQGDGGKESHDAHARAGTTSEGRRTSDDESHITSPECSGERPPDGAAVAVGSGTGRQGRGKDRRGEGKCRVERRLGRAVPKVASGTPVVPPQQPWSA